LAGLASWGVAILGAAWAVPRTLDADFARISHAHKQKDPQLGALLTTAIRRHPANDHLELIAAQDALLHKDPSALRHLNRALRLHPANWQAHYLAARTLIGLGKKSQAALEYRLAMERGLTPDLNELIKLLGSKIVDAWPQRSEDLMRLAHALAQRHMAADADAACVRAVEVAALRGPTMVERVQVAFEANDKTALLASAEVLLGSEPDAESAMIGIRALIQAGEPKAADQALERMLKAHPESSTLMLFGAQLRFERGDYLGARSLIKHTSDGSFSLVDRLRAEELLAKIADQLGEVEAAVMARARARMIGHKLSDSSAIP
jgi:predicted Zn-dependent protease